MNLNLAPAKNIYSSIYFQGSNRSVDLLGLRQPKLHGMYRYRFTETINHSVFLGLFSIYYIVCPVIVLI